MTARELEEEGIPPHSRLQGVLEYLTILGVAIAGMAQYRQTE